MLMILSATVKGGQLEIRFHPDAPVDAKRLVALAEANHKRIRIIPSFQVLARIEPAEGHDYEKTFAQVEAVLQVLEGCENLEAWPARSAGPVAN